MSTYRIEVVGPRHNAGTTIYRGDARGCRLALEEARHAYATTGVMLLVGCSAAPGVTADVFDGHRWRSLPSAPVGSA